MLTANPLIIKCLGFRTFGRCRRTAGAASCRLFLCCALAFAGAFFLAGGTRFGDVFLVVFFEVSFVPAATLEAKRGRSHHFLHAVLATLGTGFQRRIADFLQHFFLKAAGTALVFVYRHKPDHGLLNKPRIISLPT